MDALSLYFCSNFYFVSHSFCGEQEDFADWPGGKDEGNQSIRMEGIQAGQMVSVLGIDGFSGISVTGGNNAIPKRACISYRYA